MSLVIVCGCLEPGADGVGDYSRLLAAACQDLGTPTHLLALHDPLVDTPQLSQQGIEMPSGQAYRLPAVLPWPQRLALASQQLQQWQCMAISLQFVPYAFDRRGLPEALPDLIAQLCHAQERGVNSRALHLMFHEIWIGLARSSSLKSRYIGLRQRRLIQRLCKLTKPRLIHTSNLPYQLCLRVAGIEAQRLPLYSNLPTPSPAAPARSSACLTACLFGRIPPEWSPEPVIAALMARATQEQRPLRLRLLGHTHRHPGWSADLSRRWPALLLDDHGPVECPTRLAELIQGCDLGLATTPWALVEKSGTVAAFLSLGLPVVVSRTDWHLRHRWCGDNRHDLPPHANLMPLHAWERPLPSPLYVPPTPLQVARQVLQGLPHAGSSVH